MVQNKRIGIYISALLIAAILFFYGPTETKEEAPKPKEAWVTIFVHGIMSIKPHLNFENFLRFMRDDIENTPYSKTVELMRQDPHFYKNQAMQDFGLIKIDPLHVGKGNASNALALVFNEIHTLSHGKTVQNDCYTYGWSGLLSDSRRYKDAVTLYELIENLVAKYRHKGIFPKIRVIGYSHGGNIVLQLGAVRQKAAVNKELVIDEAVLLGTPIQIESDYLVNDPIFKKVYNIFSYGDRVQTLDFFSYKRFFSNRTFKERKGFKLPEKLVQIQLKVMRNTPNAREDSKKFALGYNLKSPMIVSGRSHLLRDCSPGHAELWFFGWTPLHYRDYYALYPLPSAAIIPFIVKSINEIQEPISPHHPIIFDVRPEHGMILLKNIDGKHSYKEANFIPREELAKIKEKVWAYAPDIYSPQEYDAHIKKAYNYAYNFHKDQWSVKARKKQRLTLRKKKKKTATQNT